MPSPKSFCAALGIDAENLSIGGKLKLEDKPEVHHKTIKQNREYRFPIKLKYKGDHSKEAIMHLTNKLKDKVCKSKEIVYSQYGSPYECSIERNSFQVTGTYDEVFVSFDGIAKRRLDIPTEAQRSREKQNSASGNKVGDAEIEKQVKQAEESGYRVVKSHFNSGKCLSCDDHIRVGNHIIQERGRKRGGWMHLSCGLDSKEGEIETSHSSKAHTKRKRHKS